MTAAAEILVDVPVPVAADVVLPGKRRWERAFVTADATVAVPILAPDRAETVAWTAGPGRATPGMDAPPNHAESGPDLCVWVRDSADPGAGAFAPARGGGPWDPPPVVLASSWPVPGRLDGAAPPVGTPLFAPPEPVEGLRHRLFGGRLWLADRGRRPPGWAPPPGGGVDARPGAELPSGRGHPRSPFVRPEHDAEVGGGNDPLAVVHEGRPRLRVAWPSPGARDEAIAFAQDAAARCRILGGALWAPSEGPALAHPHDRVPSLRPDPAADGFAGGGGFRLALVPEPPWPRVRGTPRPGRSAWERATPLALVAAMRGLHVPGAQGAPPRRWAACRGAGTLITAVGAPPRRWAAWIAWGADGRGVRAAALCGPDGPWDVRRQARLCADAHLRAFAAIAWGDPDMAVAAAGARVSPEIRGLFDALAERPPGVPADEAQMAAGRRANVAFGAAHMARITPWLAESFWALNLADNLDRAAGVADARRGRGGRAAANARSRL